MSQYFYTIKNLRDALAPMAHIEPKVSAEEKFSDDDLNKHRVGGRHITRREVTRSKKCNFFVFPSENNSNAIFSRCITGRFVP